MAYAGQTAPAGWIPCDGRALDGDVAQFAALRTVLGTAWGDGSSGTGAVAGVTDFNVPDLRGRFLRGVDDGVGRDPEATTRSASAPGGSAGDAVGSVQLEAFGSHGHQVGTVNYGGSPSPSYGMVVRSVINWPGGNNGAYLHYRYGPGPGGGTFVSPSDQDAVRAFASGGAETRPVNAAVRYLIKL